MKVMRKFCSRLLMVFGLVMAIGLLSPQMEVSAKTTTITVKKVDQKTAKKVHKQLMKGKAFKLRSVVSESQKKIEKHLLM